jgi:hypothetical protein
MNRIEKKHLKRMNCPSCQRPKLRFAHSVDGVEPDGGSGAQRNLRCDACKVQFLEGDTAMQAELNDVISSLTPAPVAPGR